MILGEDPVGERPAKPVTQRQLLREYAEANNITPTPKSREALPRGHKGSFDRFARGRTRELVGQVPAKTTYQDWLRQQSVEFQEDVLGKAKSKLFRDGGLTLDKFVDHNGGELSLSELAKKDRDAFVAANLDPGDYL